MNKREVNTAMSDTDYMWIKERMRDKNIKSKGGGVNS